ncbi:response regulator [Myxococcus sp. K15C18031901]|uniref:response regulator transcription factor n=1 Tax=Myxococcus dinghuensis TaxID=2906761 RepID=UPI0020A7B38F|nr:response regulator [Myxococcus dinghuensis]MCP3102590.1 response regulator [Myxococcus dinghuensis]
MIPGALVGTVLVVVHDEDLRSLLCGVLTTEGLIVAGVKDAIEALTWMEVHDAPILVVLDMDLPRLDGRDLLARLNRHSRWGGRLTVLALAARPVHHPLVIDTLTKPFDGVTLLARVRAWHLLWH